MNHIEFARKIKEKYPEYSDIDDTDLAKRMVAKYPEEYSDITFDTPKEIQQTEPSTDITAPLQAVGARYAQDVRDVNATKEPVLRQMKALNANFRGLAGAIGGTVGTVANVLVPKTTQQAIGQELGKVGSFARSPLLESVGGAFARTGVGRALYDLGKNPYIKETGTLAANIGSLYPIGVAGRAAKVGENIVAPASQAVTNVGKGLMPNELVAGTGKGMQGLANRIENISVKIGAPEQRMGAKSEYFGKYNLFGSAAKVQENAMNQIRETAAQLKAKIAEGAADPANNTNVLDLLQSAKEKALENTTFGRGKIQKEFDNILNDLVDKYGNNLENMDLADAQELKRAIGKQGDWYEAPMGGKMADDSNVKSQVFNSLYDEFKRGIETKGGPQIKELNTKLSELIPMERAASKRLLVSSRNNPIRLDDYIGGLAVAGSAASGNVLPALVAGANILSKSTAAAVGLSKAGKALESAATKPVNLGSIGKKLGGERGAIGAENPQIHTDNFKQWFGDWDKSPERASKVVDESGKPLVVYHGSPDARFANESGIFKTTEEKFTGKRPVSDAYFFTDNIEKAKSYMDPKRAWDYKNAEPGIIKTYLDIKNPRIVDWGGKEWKGTREFIAQAEKDGYDGAIIKNVKDFYTDNKSKNSTGTVYAVFSPNQIKSATGNSGAFSKSTNDIRGNTGLKMLLGSSALGGAGLTGYAALQRKKGRKLSDIGRK